MHLKWENATQWWKGVARRRRSRSMGVSGKWGVEKWPELEFRYQGIFPGKERYPDFSERSRGMATQYEMSGRHPNVSDTQQTFACPTEHCQGTKTEFLFIPREHSLKSEYRTFPENIPWNWENRSFPEIGIPGESNHQELQECYQNHCSVACSGYIDCNE